MLTTAYKVVFEDNGKLLSCNWHRPWHIRGGFSIEYKVGEWTRPKIEGTKLFVFSDLRDARYFVTQELTRELPIYSCEVENPTIPPNRLAGIVDLVDKIWTLSKLDDVDRTYTIECPRGSVCVDGVKLLERVS